MKSKAKAKSTILITLGILFTFSPTINKSFNFNAGNSDNSMDYNNDFKLDNKNLKISAVSGKIHIDNNWSAAKIAGISTGNGIYSDPYVIEDLIIDGGGSGNAILVENSNDYFIINNCTLYNADVGIKLINVMNGAIKNSTITNNLGFGADLDQSSYNLITKSVFESNYLAGIRLDQNTNFNEILNNSFIDDYMKFSKNNDNNTVKNNRLYGGSIIFGDQCDGNTIEGNYIKDKGTSTEASIVLDSQNHFNMIQNNIIQNGSGIILGGLASGNNTIINNTSSFNDYGIHMINIFSNRRSDNLVINNTFQNNNYGIRVAFASHNNITGNFMKDNNLGIEMYNAENNSIYLNIFNNPTNAIGFENNKWDNGSVGNYWRDYMGKDINDDGIGDIPYNISMSAGSQDNYPIWWDGPVISINEPYQYEIFTSNAPNFNISINEGVPDTLWYTIDSGLTNYTCSATGSIDSDTWATLPEGEITITFYAQDEVGYIGFQSVTVIKRITSQITIHGYNLFFLFGILSVVVILISQKLKKS